MPGPVRLLVPEPLAVPRPAPVLVVTGADGAATGAFAATVEAGCLERGRRTLRAGPGPTSGTPFEAGADATGQAPRLAEPLAAVADALDAAASGQWDVVVVEVGPAAALLDALVRAHRERHAAQRQRPGHRLLERLGAEPAPGPRDRAGTATGGRGGVPHEVAAGVVAAVTAALVDPDRTRTRVVVNAEAGRDPAVGRSLAAALAWAGAPPDAMVVGPEDPSVPWRCPTVVEGSPALDATADPSGCTAATDPGAPGAWTLPVLACAPARPADPAAGARCAVHHLDPLSLGAPPAWPGAGVPVASGAPVRVVQGPQGWSLQVGLPHARREDLHLTRQGADLLVAVGGHERAIRLPASLARRPVTQASWCGDHLSVHFGSPAAAGAAPTGATPPGPQWQTE